MVASYLWMSLELPVEVEKGVGDTTSSIDEDCPCGGSKEESVEDGRGVEQRY